MIYKYMILALLVLLSSTIQANPRYCSYQDYCNNCQGSNKPSWCNSCSRTYQCQEVLYYELQEIPRIVELPPRVQPRIPNDPRCLSCPNSEIYIPQPQIQRQW